MTKIIEQPQPPLTNPCRLGYNKQRTFGNGEGGNNDATRQFALGAPGVGAEGNGKGVCRGLVRVVGGAPAVWGGSGTCPYSLCAKDIRFDFVYGEEPIRR